MFSPRRVDGANIGLSGWAIGLVAPLLMFLMYVLPYLIAGGIVVGWVYLICCWIGDREWTLAKGGKS